MVVIARYAAFLLCLLLAVYSGWWVSTSYENGDLRRYIFNSKFGQQYFLKKEEKRSFHLSHGAVNCPTDNYFGIASFGQSHFSNVMLRQEAVDLSSLDVVMYDWVSGHCFPYKEPLVGTTGSFGRNNFKDQITQEVLSTKYPYIGGNMMTTLIEKLRGQGFNRTIVVGAFAVGGSSAFYWSNGRQLSRLNAFLQRSKQRNINFDLFLWHQGSTDAIPRLYNHHSKVAVGHESKTKFQLYKSALEKIFRQVKLSYPLTKIGIAISSKCNGAWISQKSSGDEEDIFKHYIDNEIGDAQRVVALQSDDYFISAETNDLLGRYLWDGCHYYPRGEDVVATRYLESILSNLSQVIK